MQVSVEWLGKASRGGRLAGKYLVLLYLVCGRLPEALEACRSCAAARRGDLWIRLTLRISGFTSSLCLPADLLNA